MAIVYEKIEEKDRNFHRSQAGEWQVGTLLEADSCNMVMVVDDSHGTKFFVSFAAGPMIIESNAMMRVRLFRGDLRLRNP